MDQYFFEARELTTEDFATLQHTEVNRNQRKLQESCLGKVVAACVSYWWHLPVSV
jgi:hypothetical protein